jgi:hypothetical protein
VLHYAYSEVTAVEQWDQSVDEAIKKLVSDYQEKYIDNPDHYDAFNQSAVRLLELIDIPQLKSFFKALRWFFSWPSLLILRFGGKIWRSASKGGAPKTPYELETFQQAGTDLMNDLYAVIDRHRAEPDHHPFWDHLYTDWQPEVDDLYKKMDGLLKDHWEQVKKQIDDTADQIFEKLKQNPRALTTVRVAVVTSNAFAPLIALATAWEQTGATDFGINLVHDAILIPLIFTLVQNITTFIAASYIENCKQELKNALKQEAERFGNKVYRTRFIELSQKAARETCVLPISKDSLRTLPERIAELDLLIS